MSLTPHLTLYTGNSEQYCAPHHQKKRRKKKNQSNSSARKRWRELGRDEQTFFI